MTENYQDIQKINKKIPKYALEAINILENNNFEAWFIGGFVRNIILNNTSNLQNTDIDITTNARPEQIKNAFKKANWKYFNIGEKFGTITVIVPKQLLENDVYSQIEITCYRREIAYLDNRHPEHLKFSDSIDEDLARRDFTINAIAFNPQKGIYDLYNGIDAIKNKTIKTVGNPKDRFEEDYLRILRAIRFSAQLGFTVEENAKKEIFALKDKINNISSERIRDELSKILCAKYSLDVLEKYKEIIFAIIPDLKDLDGFDQKTKYHCYDIYMHTLVCADKMPIAKYKNTTDTKTSNLLDNIGKWSALLHDIGKPKCFTIGANGQGHFFGHPQISSTLAKKILKNLKFSNKFINSVLLLIRWHDLPFSKIDKTIIKLYRKFCESNIALDSKLLFKLYCDLRRADSYAHHPEYQEYVYYTDKVEERFNQMIKNEQVFCIKDLRISGNDIINLGIKPGKKIENLLNKCLDAVINKEIKNEKKSLTNFLKQII